MSPTHQLPLLYDPPDLEEALDHLKTMAAHHDAIKEVAERLLEAYRAFEDGRMEGMETLKEILERSEEVALLISTVRATMVEIGRERDTIWVQRNEAIQERDQFLGALHGVLARFQRKARS